MNNSNIIEEKDEEVKLPILREKSIKLAELVGALSTLVQSNYWKIVESEFNDDLGKLVSRLEKEKDTVEIFRLQGEIKGTKKIDLEKMLTSKRQELEIIKKQI